MAETPATPTRTFTVVDTTTGDEIDISSLDPSLPRTGVAAQGQVTPVEVVGNQPAPTPVSTGADRWWFCLGAHAKAAMDSADRLFEGPSEGCPICPVCTDENGKNIQVNALPTEAGVVPNTNPQVRPGYGG